MALEDPFIGEIKLVSFSFPPKGWALCNGQLLPINQNQALFALLGTQYGGNGQTTFALPDLRGCTPLHGGGGANMGVRGGEYTHTLSVNELPAHTHPLFAAHRPGTSQTAAGNILAAHRGGYADSTDAALQAATLASVGGSQPHNNMAPYLVLNYIIALVGVFPSRN